MAYYKEQDAYAGVAASGITGNILNVAGYREIMVQITGSPSTTTIAGSIDSGTTQAPANWSTITVVIGPKYFTLCPDNKADGMGSKWLRFQRSETTTAVIAGYRDLY